MKQSDLRNLKLFSSSEISLDLDEFNTLQQELLVSLLNSDIQPTVVARILAHISKEDLVFTTCRQYTILHLAILTENIDKLELVLQCLKNLEIDLIDKSDVFFRTPSAIAMESYNAAPMLALLKQFGANLKQLDPLELSLLHVAAKNNNVDGAAFLIEKNGPSMVYHKNKLALTPLETAIIFGAMATAKLLLGQGYNLEHASTYKELNFRELILSGKIDKATLYAKQHGLDWNSEGVKLTQSERDSMHSRLSELKIDSPLPTYKLKLFVPIIYALLNGNLQQIFSCLKEGATLNYSVLKECFTKTGCNISWYVEDETNNLYLVDPQSVDKILVIKKDDISIHDINAVGNPIFSQILNDLNDLEEEIDLQGSDIEEYSD